MQASEESICSEAKGPSLQKLSSSSLPSPTPDPTAVTCTAVPPLYTVSSRRLPLSFHLCLQQGTE